MNKITTPQAKDWDNYWSLDKTQRFTKISWSKKRIINILSLYLKPGSAVLDAGCGSGFFSNFFFEQGLSVTALDYSQEALNIAKSMTGGKIKTFCCDLLNEEIPHQLPDRYDLIFTDGLFEHFSDQKQDVIFQNLKKLLKQQGYIVTFVPNRWSPWEIIRPFYMPGIEEDPFTLKQLVNLNQRNGMDIVEKGGINTFPFSFSPDKWLGSSFGMLLFTISKKS